MAPKQAKPNKNTANNSKNQLEKEDREKKQQQNLKYEDG